MEKRDFQMRDPMPNKMPTKRVKWSCYVYPSSWAWLRDLRQNHQDQRLFACDPYAEVYPFRENVYGIFTENLDGMGDMWQYLIVGPEKAMLIDTGFGLGDYKALCDEITGGKELIVVNTHYGVDHALGNCRFDRVYCHETLVKKLERQHAGMWDYLFDENGNGIWLEFDRNQLPQFRPYEIVGVPDGYTWNLGGDYEIELFFTGGHMDHHAVFLDKHHRALFCGDIICSSMTNCGALSPRSNLDYPEYGTMAFYRERLARLLERSDEFDSVFPGHYIVDVDPAVLYDELRTIDFILAHPDAFDFAEEGVGKDGKPRVTRYKCIPNFGVITY